MKKKLTMMLACLFLTIGAALAQTTVTGTVISHEDGQPVIGATVKVVGTNTGAVTDFNGRFEVKVPKSASEVEVSYVGMVTQRAAIRKGMRIMLYADQKMLDEVMVVAYGTQKKSSFTGSASQVKQETIEAHVATDVTSALKGNAPGVQVISTSGDPAQGGNTIRVRGFGSMAASSAPLIVLDGVPYEGSLSSINMNDIADMNVLKDAASTAIYGARGGNGVILLTSKKGQNQEAQIKFDAKWGGTSRMIPQYDVITDPGQFYEVTFKQLYNTQYYYGKTAEEAYATACNQIYDQQNGGLGYQIFTVPEGQNLIGTNLKLNPNATLGYSDGTYYYTPDDWYDEAYHSGSRQEYNISASGTSDRLNYFASGNYLKDGGIVDNSDFTRYTGSINADYKIKEWMHLTTKMRYTHSEGKNPYTTSTYGSSGNMFYISNNIAPIYPVYVRNADGSLMMEDGRVVYDSNNTNFKRAGFVGNALRDNAYDRYGFNRDMFDGKWALVLTPVKGLKLTASLGAMNNNLRSTSLYTVFGSGSATDGATTVTNTRTFDINQQYLAEYATDFGKPDVHNFTILAGYEQSQYKYQYHYGYNTHLYDPFIGELGNATGAETNNLSSYTQQRLIKSWIGRAQYDLFSRYFLSASIRRDGNSRFADGHRWGTFGSIGGAWLINKESWFDVNWVDELKFKISYGVMGNEDLSDYAPYSTIYDASYNTGNGQYSISMTSKGNNELTWEKIKSFNVGFDFALFKERLSGSFEYYCRNTSDMLYYKDMPLSTGVTGTYPVNVGSVQNKGFEFSVRGDIIRTKDINWSANFNISYLKNKITDLDESVRKNGIIGSTYIRRVGGSQYEAYLYKYAGVCQQTDVDNADNGFTASDLGKAMYWAKVYKTNADGKQIDEDGNLCSESGKDPVWISDKKVVSVDKASKYDCGATYAPWYGGFGTNLSLYGFDIGIQLAFQLGGKIYDGVYQRFMHTQASAGTNWHKDILNAWTPENTNTNIPRLDGAADSQYGLSQSACDFFQVSARYLSINNITIGYNVPKKLLAKIGVEGLRVYATGENLAVFAARKGLNPFYSFGIGGYTSGSGMTSDSYGPRRSIVGGISLSF